MLKSINIIVLFIVNKNNHIFQSHWLIVLFLFFLLLVFVSYLCIWQNTIILERGYIPVYLPPYSPKLNPIEMFWKVLKERVRREKLKDTETLSSRIIGGSEDVPVEHIQKFIQHSINVIPKCLNKEPLWLLYSLVKIFLKSGQFRFKHETKFVSFFWAI